MVTQNNWGSDTNVQVAKGGTGQTTYTNGQLLIGNTTGNTLSKATLTEGSGVTITNGAGTITIAASGGTPSVTSAFLAYLATTVTNVTGHGAVFTLGTTTALTEVFDTGSDFNTNGTYTAPSNGKYLLTGGCNIIDYSASGAVVSTIVTSNGSYKVFIGEFSNPPSVGCAGSVFCDMDTSDTATITVSAAGLIGNTADVSGTGRESFFSGLILST